MSRDTAGRIQLDGGLAEGEIPTVANRVIIGHLCDSAPVPGTVTGLKDAQAAEVHISCSRTTAPPTRTENGSGPQLSGFHTACNPDCVDVQFAAHLP